MVILLWRTGNFIELTTLVPTAFVALLAESGRRSDSLRSERVKRS